MHQNKITNLIEVYAFVQQIIQTGDILLGEEL